MKKRTHNIYVTKLVEPKVINRVGRSHKVTFSELLIGLRGGNVELVQDPFLDETLVASGLFVAVRTTEAFTFKTGWNKLWVSVRV